MASSTGSSTRSSRRTRRSGSPTSSRPPPTPDRPMATVEVLLRDAVERIRAAGSESPRLDAELLLANVLGIDRTGVLAHPEAAVGDGAAARFAETVGRRVAGEPVAYLRGVQEF